MRAWSVLITNQPTMLGSSNLPSLRALLRLSRGRRTDVTSPGSTSFPTHATVTFPHPPSSSSLHSNPTSQNFQKLKNIQIGKFQLENFQVGKFQIETFQIGKFSTRNFQVGKFQTENFQNGKISSRFTKNRLRAWGISSRFRKNSTRLNFGFEEISILDHAPRVSVRQLVREIRNLGAPAS